MSIDNFSNSAELDPACRITDASSAKPLVSDAERNAAFIARLRQEGKYPPVLPPYTPATGEELLESSRY